MIKLEKTREIDGQVIAVIPEYKQVRVRSSDGHLFSITQRAEGPMPVLLLREGQRVRCIVTMRLPRVLSFDLQPEQS